MPDFLQPEEMTPEEMISEEAARAPAEPEPPPAELEPPPAEPEPPPPEPVLDEIAIERANGEGLANEPPAEEPALPIDARQWYIIHTYSGFERKVAESLKTRAEAFGFAEQIGQILIPEEEVVELRNGKKVTSKRLLYPGYVVV